jgi:hypothetical protein
MDDTISVQVLAQTQTRQRRRIRCLPTLGAKKKKKKFGEEQIRYKKGIKEFHRRQTTKFH